MDLKEFVSATLTQIVDGVIEAQKQVPGERINPRMSSLTEIDKLGLVGFAGVQMIKFDVALSTSEGATTQAKAGVFVAPIAFGAQGQSIAASGTVSRVQFAVPLALPKGEGKH
jgi:hypothetical protein